LYVKSADNGIVKFNITDNTCKYQILIIIFLQGIFILGAISYSELKYKRKTVTYVYPSWAITVGWTLASISVIWIPIIMVKRIFDAQGTLQEVC